MFSNYTIYDPDSHKSVAICKLSYVCAGLFGTVYFALKAGRTRLLAAVGLSLLCVAALVGVLFVSSMLPASQQFIAMIVVAPAVMIFQSVKTVNLVKSSYRRRQWQVRQDD